ncbi:MAG TPA: sugar transferase, partial [Polyangiaceae bacterium]|nr:sugar transferase [Polyangiaceae bacterium]
MIDLVASLAGLTLTVPFYPLIAIAIKLDSPGPIFYKQRRAGAMKRGKAGEAPEFSDFWIVKFRTMRTDAEKNTGAVIASKGDPRITKIGRFLRKTRIDELPQFLNVLRGDMSLVGPRPERPELLADLALAIPFFEERLREAKPGLTGLAQVTLGYTGAMPDDSELAPFRDILQNPFDLPEADGALADDMRIKLLYDLAYCAALEKFSTYLAMELRVML